MFQTSPLTFEKVASTKLLSENPEQWANEILAQLYHQHPYLGAYKVDLQEQGKDEERGYYYGYFLVSPPAAPPELDPATGQVARQTPGMEEQQAAEGGSPSLRIPVVINRRKLSQLDVMIDSNGTFMPLSEVRMTQLLSDPAIFEATKAQPPSPMYGNEALPSAPGPGSSNGMLYEKAAGLRMLDLLAPRLTPKVKQAFLSLFEQDPELQWALDNNESFREAVGRVYLAKTASTTEHVADTRMKMPATAIVFTKVAGGVEMLSANAGAFEPESVFIPRANTDLLPEGILPRVQHEGLALWSRESPYQPDETQFETIKEAGCYAVVTSQGDVIESMVIPEVFDFAGRRLDLTLALNPSGHSLQEKVAGAQLGPIELVGDEERGQGVYISPDGTRATLPCTIRMGLGRDLLAEVDTGSVRLTKVAHLQAPMPLSGGRIAVPESWIFCALGARQPILSESHLAKQASAIPDQAREVRVLYTSGSYSFRGGCGVESLPRESREFVKEASAWLLLGCLGLDHESAKEKIAEASVRGSAVVYGGRDLVSYAQQITSAREKMASIYREIDLRPVNLVKEAAALADEESIDAVLSLGFATPDNVAVFLENIDALEETSHKLAELVIACRLGVPDVPEAAATRALSGIDKVIEGLRLLEARMSQPEEAAA